MRFSFDWLKRHLNTSKTIDEIADMLTFLGLEVEEVVNPDKIFKNFVIASVGNVEKHPNADKLLISQVDIGSEIRQVISGIAKYYKPEELVGKKVIVVRNLKEANLRGEKSYGMILCASDKQNDLLEIIEINHLEPGDIVS